MKYQFFIGKSLGLVRIGLLLNLFFYTTAFATTDNNLFSYKIQFVSYRALSQIEHHKTQQKEMIEYNIDNFLLEKYSFSHTRYFLSYIQDKFIDNNDDHLDENTKKMMKVLNIGSYVPNCKNIFVSIEIADIAGSAQYKEEQCDFNSEHIFLDIVYNSNPSLNLKADEFNVYIGLGLQKYIMPTLIASEDGSLKNREIKQVLFDPEFELSCVAVVFGGKGVGRSKYKNIYYYMNMQDFLGLSIGKVSDEIIDTFNESGKHDNSIYGFCIGFDWEVGVEYKAKIANIYYDIGLGYRIRANAAEGNPFSNSSDLIYERKDIMHGPTLNFSIIF